MSFFVEILKIYDLCSNNAQIRIISVVFILVWKKINTYLLRFYIKNKKKERESEQTRRAISMTLTGVEIFV